MRKCSIDKKKSLLYNNLIWILSYTFFVQKGAFYYGREKEYYDIRRP